MMNKFWIVMADKPSTTITHRHATFESAKNEAFRLSQNNEGKFFFVLEVIGGVGVQPMPAHWHDAGDDTKPVGPHTYEDITPHVPIPMPDDTTVGPWGKIWLHYRSGGTKNDDPNP